MAGTNLCTRRDLVIQPILTDDLGMNLIVKGASGSAAGNPAGYATGCLYLSTDNGAIYSNTGTNLAATWTLNASSTITNATAFTDNATTTTNSVSITEGAQFTTGAAYAAIFPAAFANTGAGFYASMLAATTGCGFKALTTGAYTGAGMVQLSAVNITTGRGVYVLGGTNMGVTGSLFYGDMGAAINGAGITLITTGAYVDNTGLFRLIATAAQSGVLMAINGSGLTTGQGLNILGGALATGGSLAYLDLNAGAAGQCLTCITTAAYTGTGMITVTAGAMTTGILISLVSTTGLTSGSLLRATTSTAGALSVNGAYSFRGTGAHTGITVGLFDVLSSATTAGLVGRFSGTALVGGLVLQLQATAATLTTGRYLSCNDAATEVFGIGCNGHVISTVSAVPPTIGTNASGISACAITAGGTDTCGVITTTGTPISGTVLTVTFGKTYTTAPKAVLLYPVNATAGWLNTMPYISTVSATTFVMTYGAGGTYGATPSYMYLVIA